MKKRLLWIGGTALAAGAALSFMYMEKKEIDASTHRQLPPADVEVELHNNYVAETEIQATDLLVFQDKNTHLDPKFASDESSAVSLGSKTEIESAVRQHVIQKVQLEYSQLFRHLDVDAEKALQVARLLVEEQVDERLIMSTTERAESISEILGEEQALTFLTLEEDIGSYAQVARIAEHFRGTGESLTQAQADQLLNAHKTIIENYESKSTNGETLTMDEIILEMNDKLRLVTERSSAFLTPKQMAKLVSYNDDLTNRRLYSIDRQVRKTGEEPTFFPAH